MRRFILKPHSFLFFFPFVLCSCASVPAVQPQVNSLVVSGNLTSAIDVLNTKSELYGKNNALLYYMDRGMVLQLAGRYSESIAAFEKAKVIIDDLYTKSFSKIAASWLMNDYFTPYRGENFEHILVNILQAINFAVLDNVPEALVEARDMDLKLLALKELYPEEKKNIYMDDAFGRFLMGILYESTGNDMDLNDAFISYKKALEDYESDFYISQNADVPETLKENILSVAKALNLPEFNDYQKRFPKTTFLGQDEKNQKGEIYLIHYNGLSPIKHPNSIYVPLPGAATKLSFPKYDTRDFDIKTSVFKAVIPYTYTTYAKTELGHNIEALALKDLESRKFGIYAKAVGRPFFKYAIEQALLYKADEKQGQSSAYAVAGASSLYNIYSERADLRSWQTLPGQIRIARLLLKPGTYHFYLENMDGSEHMVKENDLGEIGLKAGQTKFILNRTVR